MNLISIELRKKICILFVAFFASTVILYAQDTTALKQKLTVAMADTAKVKLLNELTASFENKAPSRALKYAEEAYKLAKRSKYNKGMARALINMGALEMYLGDHSKALATNQALYQLCKQMGDPIGMVSSLNNIAAVYQRNSKSTEAATYGFKALRTAEQIKDNELIAVCLSNIATLFTQQRDFKKAIIYAKKAQVLYKNLKQPENEAKNLETLGNCYAFNGNVQGAKPYYTRALEIYERLGNEMGKAIMYTQMVDLFADDPLKQIEYLNNAKAIWDKIAPNHINAISNVGNYGYTLFQILQNPAKLKIVQEKFGLSKAQILTDADNYFKKGILLSKRVGQSELVTMLTIEYAKLCEYKGDFKGALANIKLHYQVQDSLYSQENKNKIASLEAQFEFQKKEDLYKQQQELAKIKNQQLYLYAGLAIVLISSVLLYFLNIYRIRQLRLKNRLQQKEAEEKARELLHQSKLFESELKVLRSQMNPHFIFNVLNSIESYIMDNDKNTASRLVQKFAALSRLILENSIQSLVTADKEWKALILYTELEAIRYNNSFSYQFIVDDRIKLKKMLLPPMLIQPLIENAILHGLISKPTLGANLKVELTQQDNFVCITVTDNGIGILNKVPNKNTNIYKEKSFGIDAIKERIEMLNNGNKQFNASFDIKSGPNNKGTIAKLVLPISYSSVLEIND